MIKSKHLNNYKKVFSFIIHNIKQFRARIVLSLSILTFTQITTRFVEAFLLKIVVDTIATQSPSIELAKQIFTYILIYSGIQLFTVMMARVNYILSSYAYDHFISITYTKSLQKVLSLSNDFFENNQSGSILSKIRRFMNSCTGICRILHHNVYKLFITLTVSIIGLSYVDPRLGIALILFVIIYTLVTTKITSRFATILEEPGKIHSNLIGLLTDDLTNILTLKTFGKTQQELDNFQSTANTYSNAVYKKDKFYEIINGIQVAFMILIEFIIWLVLIEGWQQGNIQAGDMAFVQSLLFASFHKLWGFGSTLLDIDNSVYDAMEMLDIFDTKSSLDLQPNPATDFQIKKGELSISKLNFSYNQEVEVFKDLNLQIPAGQKVGIVGHSGSGKSTLIKLLLRLMDPQDGSIQCDNTDLKQIDLDTYRSQISYVPQQPMLFHRSILDNISYANPNANKEQVIEVAKKAHVHEFVSKLPNKYNSLVGERGIKLSGGERQRIAIARAMLEPNKVLILDEATSALDSISEKFIQDSFQELMQDRTTIVIAHRLSTIQQLDRIIVFDQGRIIEDGSHQELLAKKGHYYELWSHQNEGFLQD